MSSFVGGLLIGLFVGALIGFFTSVLMYAISRK